MSFSDTPHTWPHPTAPPSIRNEMRALTLPKLSTSHANGAMDHSPHFPKSPDRLVSAPSRTSSGASSPKSSIFSTSRANSRWPSLGSPPTSPGSPNTLKSALHDLVEEEDEKYDPDDFSYLDSENYPIEPI